MKPFHLQIQRVPESRRLSFQGFGPSAIHPEGSQALPLSVDAIDAAADGSVVEEAWAGAAPPAGAWRGGVTQRVPKSREPGHLPSLDHLQQDSDLDNIRDQPWFQAFLAEWDEDDTGS